MQTESTEMYLITVYRLTRQAPRALTKDIATRLKISQPSVSEQLKRLTKQGYLNYQWREGATLTKKGERIAINVLRKHRLIETFLVEMAGYAIDEVHDEACDIEHAASDRLVDSLEAILGYPTVDPHGHPIPAKDGSVADVNYLSLAEVSPGETVVIRQINDWEREALQYLRQLDLVPGAEITLLAAAPFDGPITLIMGEENIAIAPAMAQKIGVSRS